MDKASEKVKGNLWSFMEIWLWLLITSGPSCFYRIWPGGLLIDLNNLIWNISIKAKEKRKKKLSSKSNCCLSRQKWLKVEKLMKKYWKPKQTSTRLRNIWYPDNCICLIKWQARVRLIYPTWPAGSLWPSASCLKPDMT